MIGLFFHDGRSTNAPKSYSLRHHVVKLGLPEQEWIKDFQPLDLEQI